MILLKVTTAKNAWFVTIRDNVCNGCHDLSMLCLNKSNIAIITVKNVDYHCIMYNISKSEGINLLENSVLDSISRSKAVNLLENFVLEDRGYI